MMHDMSITENYSIFLDHPLCLDGAKMAQGGMPFAFDEEAGSRYGIMPRHGTTAEDAKWFDLPSHMVFHTANAWEEGHEVVLWGCRMPKIELQPPADKEIQVTSKLTEFRFNMKTGCVISP